MRTMMVCMMAIVNLAVCPGTLAQDANSSGDDAADQAAVKTVVESVATFADRGEYYALEALFAEEFMLDYSALTGQPAELKQPRELMLEWAAVLPGFDRTRHDLSDVIATVEGARASASANVTAGHWINGAYWEVSGRYDYMLERSADGDWRIRSMTFTLANEHGSRAVFGPAMAQAAANPPAIVLEAQSNPPTCQCAPDPHED